MNQRLPRPPVVADPVPAPWVSEVPGGVRIRVRAVPGAGRDAVVGMRGEALRVAVRAVPERGKANEAVCGVVAAAAGVPRRDVEIVSGHRGREKIVLVRGLGREDARLRIEETTDGRETRR